MVVGADDHIRFWRNYSGLSARLRHIGRKQSASAYIDFLGAFDLTSPDQTLPLHAGRQALPSSLATLFGHEGAVTGALRLGEDRVLSWSRDHTLRLWSLEGEPIGAPWRGHESWITGALRLGEDRVLSWSDDHTLRLWSLEGEPMGEPWRGHESFIIGALRLGEDRVLSWSNDHTLRLWSLEGEPRGTPWRGHEDWITGALRLGEDRVLSWSTDGTLRLWSLEGQCLRVIFTPLSSTQGVLELNPKTLIVLGRRGFLKLELSNVVDTP